MRKFFEFYLEKSKIVYIASLSVILFSGCAPSKILLKSFGSFEKVSSVYLQESDLALVRESLPSTLKFLEMIIQEVPNNEDLLIAAAQGYTLYSYGFVYHDYENLIETDFEKAIEERNRAFLFYKRARSYAMNALSIRHSDFEEQILSDPEKAIQGTSLSDIPALYWLGVSWAGCISTKKDDVSLLLDLPKIQMIFQHILLLDDAYNNGSVHEMMIALLSSLPSSGEREVVRSKKHYEKALELSKGERASVYVSYAEYLSIRNKDKEEFIQLLNKALEIDLQKNPSIRLENALSQERARWLMKKVDDYFL